LIVSLYAQLWLSDARTYRLRSPSSSLLASSLLKFRHYVARQVSQCATSRDGIKKVFTAHHLAAHFAIGRAGLPRELSMTFCAASIY